MFYLLNMTVILYVIVGKMCNVVLSIKFSLQRKLCVSMVAIKLCPEKSLFLLVAQNKNKTALNIFVLYSTYVVVVRFRYFKCPTISRENRLKHVNDLSHFVLVKEGKSCPAARAGFGQKPARARPLYC